MFYHNYLILVKKINIFYHCNSKPELSEMKIILEA